MTETPRGIIDRLLPPSSFENPDTLRRGRLFAICSVVLAAGSLFFCVTGWPGHLDPTSALLGLGSLLCLGNIAAARIKDDVGVGAVLLCIEHQVVLLVLAGIGTGVGDPTLTWMSLAPLVASFLLGPRAGVAAAITGSLGLLAIYVAERSGHRFHPPASDWSLFVTLGMMTSLAGIAALTQSYERSRLQSVELVRATLERLQKTNSELSEVAAALSSARDGAVAENSRKTNFIEDMQRFSVTQTAALERSRLSTERLSLTIKSIANSVETLARAASTSDFAIDAVVGASTEVGRSMTTMVAAVDEADTALRALRGAVTSVQSGFGALRTQAEVTASSMVTMEKSAAAVEESAMRTAALSSAVITDAVRGSEAMRRSVSGIEQIRSTAVGVSQAMSELLGQIEEVDRILTVIDEVTVETNVLALNASIIAAQAGERGSGFRVVAEQIKALAARTATSTRASAGVIDLVKGRARHAGEALKDAVSAVDAGLGLSKDAASALEQILRSATEAEAMARGIEARTVEQLQQAEAVGAAMSKVMREVQNGAGAALDHSRTATQIDEAILRVKKLAPELAKRATEQTESSRAVRAAIAEVNAMAQQLAAVQGEQTHAAEETFASADELHRAQRGAAAALAALIRG